MPAFSEFDHPNPFLRFAVCRLADVSPEHPAVGNNFFLDMECIGKQRAEHITRLLVEMNGEVRHRPRSFSWRAPGVSLKRLLACRLSATLSTKIP